MMRLQRYRTGVVFLIALSSLALLSPLGACDRADSVGTPPGRQQGAGVIPLRIAEIGYRQQAIVHPLPTYPVRSVNLETEGVAVASIVTGTDGRVESVELLQAPDEEIGRRVVEALQTWVFHPLRAATGENGEMEVNRAESRVTFYFLIVNGVGVVSNPAADMSIGSEMEAVVQDLRNVDLDTAFGSLKPVFVDIRDRADYQLGHYPDSVNIPVSELLLRSQVELSREQFVVILCPGTPGFSWTFCTRLARDVGHSGFEHIGVLLNPGG